MDMDRCWEVTSIVYTDIVIRAAVSLPRYRHAGIFSLPAVVSGIKFEVTGSVPAVVNSVYSANNVNAGKIAGSEQRSVVDAGIYSHSVAAGAVPVMNFWEKLQQL